MTESDWLDCPNPALMLGLLYRRGQAGDRKLRLFACACCRQVWNRRGHGYFPGESAEGFAVETAERFADGLASAAELAAARDALRPPANRAVSRLPRRCSTVSREAARSAADESAWEAARRTAEHTARLYSLEVTRGGAWNERKKPARDWALARATAAHADVLRDLFGNPFHPVSVERAWLEWNDGAVPKMARAIDEGRSFDDLPLLADALEEGGCTSGDLLDHCRDDAEHHRGCWAIDALLGRA